MAHIAQLQINNVIVLNKAFSQRPDDTQLEAWLEANWSITRPHWNMLRGLVEQVASTSKKVSVKQGAVTLSIA